MENTQQKDASSPIFSEEEEKEIAKITERLLNGGTLGDERGLGNKQLEAIYSIGHNLYEHGKYGEAEKIFSFLCLYSHLEKKFWKGLAACRQLQKNYIKATDAYAVAALTDAEDPEPAFYAASCFLSAKEPDKAEKALQAAIHLSADKKEFLPIKKQSLEILKSLKHNLKHRQDEQKP